MPRQTDARLILQRRLVEQIALAVRRLMVLQRVIRKMLLAFGEHHAVDLRVGAVADQRHVLIDFGQPAAQRADGPLQLAVALRPAPFDGRSATRRCPSFADSRSAAWRRGRRSVRSRRSASRRRVGRAGWRFRPAAWLRPLLRESTSVWPKSTPPGDIAESMCSGSSITTPLGTYSSVPPDQQAACSAANLSCMRIDDARNRCGANQIAVLVRPARRGCRTARRCSATLRFKLGRRRPAVERRSLAAEFDAVRQQRRAAVAGAGAARRRLGKRELDRAGTAGCRSASTLRRRGWAAADLRNACQAARRPATSQAGSSRPARKASNASCVNPVWFNVLGMMR